MINTLSLLFSLAAVCFVVVRAAMLDKMLPWFKPPPDVVPGFKRKRSARPYR